MKSVERVLPTLGLYLDFVSGTFEARAVCVGPIGLGKLDVGFIIEAGINKPAPARPLSMEMLPRYTVDFCPEDEVRVLLANGWQLLCTYDATKTMADQLSRVIGLLYAWPDVKASK
jgi:hypothetical protein